MRLKKISFKVLRDIPIIILVLLFSYDLLTYLPELFSASIVKVIYYSFLILLYTLYILTIQRKGKLTFYPKDLFFQITSLFCLMFLIRIVYDLYIVNIIHTTYTNKFTYIFLFINSVIIPLFALKIIDYSKINFTKLYIIFSILIIFCLIISFNNVILQGFIGNRYSANRGLDTISYGHLGITLFLLSLTFFINSTSLKIKILNCIVMLFGLFSSVLANSRSPIVALIGCIVFYTFVTKHYKILVVSLFAISLFVVFIDQINTFFLSFGSGFVQRIIQSVSLGSTSDVTSGRTTIYSIGIEQFSKSPFIGSSFLIQNGIFRGEYVHNLILEAFMSVGIWGGLFYISSILITLKNAYQLINIHQKYLFVSFLFIQYLIFSMFSRSIISLPLFWLSLFMVNSICIYEKKNPANKDYPSGTTKL